MASISGGSECGPMTIDDVLLSLTNHSATEWLASERIYRNRELKKGRYGLPYRQRQCAE